MSGPGSVALPLSVAPDQLFDISVNLIAPNTPGTYQGFWGLQKPNGEAFILNASVKDNIWVKIDVVASAPGTPTLTPQALTATAAIQTPISQATSTLDVTYDFVANACAAQWESTDGSLACPGLDGDIHGFITKSGQANLEDGTTVSLPALLTFPSSSANGTIQGTYPDVQILTGDHLQASVGCEFGATSCSVLFSIRIIDATGVSHDVWTLGEFYDGNYFNLDLDLGRFAGQKSKVVLSVSSLGNSAGDRALWVAPRIVNFPVSIPTPGVTSTPVLPISTASITQTPTAGSAGTGTAVPVPTTTPQGPLPSIQQIINNIISFFNQLLGGK